MSDVPMTHVGTMKLRQLRAGELPDGEARTVREHASGCEGCRGKLEELEEEQARFEAAVSFERFAAGVERAARPAPATPVRRWTTAALAMAASLLLAVPVARFLSPGGDPSRNRLKGGAGIELRIAGPGGQSQRDAPEMAPALLSPGERVRIGYRAADHRFVTVVSVDEGGQVTPIYPERGESLPAGGGNATIYLPESLEFTGSGAERVIVVLSDEPLQVDQVAAAAGAAFAAARGDLSGMRALAVPGEQFARTVQKP